jgi:hypothetical protein
MAAGVEVPLITARAFDYAVRALFVWESEGRRRAVQNCSAAGVGL